MYAFGILGTLVLVLGAWLLVTGKNFPGLLGRGFTQGDNLRMKRAPAQFIRALGLMSVLAWFFAFFSAWIVSLLPRPSTESMVIVGVVAAIFVIPMGASFAWLMLVAARHRLFRWDKP